MDIIITAYYIPGLELMKLIFAVLEVSLTMGIHVVIKQKVFIHLLINTLNVYCVHIKLFVLYCCMYQMLL